MSDIDQQLIEKVERLLLINKELVQQNQMLTNLLIEKDNVLLTTSAKRIAKPKV